MSLSTIVTISVGETRLELIHTPHGYSVIIHTPHGYSVSFTDHP